MTVTEVNTAGEQTPAPADRNWPRPWMSTFFAALSTVPDVTNACRVARVGRRTVYDARDGRAERPDGKAARPPVPGFADAWDEALQIAQDAVQRQAHTWIMGGVPVRSVRTKTVRKTDKDGATIETTTETVETESAERSATLMIFWLKAWFPERYRWSERAEVTGADGGPVQVANIDDLDRQIAELSAELLSRAQERGEPVPDE